MNLKNCIFTVLVGSLLLSSNSVSAKRKKKASAKTEQKADSASAVKGLPAVEKFIKPSAKKSEGMFNVIEQDKKYFLEIPHKLMGRDIFVFLSLVQGSAQEVRGPRDMKGYAGDQLSSSVVRFELGEDDRLYLKEPKFDTALPNKDSELYEAVKRSWLTPIANGFDLKAKGDSSVVIDITEQYKSDSKYFSLFSAKTELGLGGYQADKSYPTTISVFPENVIFRSVRSYSAGSPKKDLKGKNLPAGPTTWEVASSWYLLPEKPMQPRHLDARVLYFATAWTDYSLNPVKAEQVAAACRWRLEPKAEDLQKYINGELVEPAKPIVYYIDKNTPKYLQEPMRRGIESWQKAFEKIGFKNAIQARIEPTKEEDPNFSPEDVRYSYVSYKASSISNAYGPMVFDPRSGEILTSHVGIFHNVLDLARTWYFAQTAAAVPEARRWPYDEKLMGDLMEYIICHEIGHTLGLRHNFASSWTYDLQDIRNKDFVRRESHGASVMDYMRFNYVAQPGDGFTTTDVIPHLGDYDFYAIEWGYRYLPQFIGKPMEEKQYLMKWATRQRKNNHRLEFGIETDRWDPRFQAEDLTSDAIAANELGMQNLKFIADSIPAWSERCYEGDEEYVALKEMTQAIRSQHWRYISHALKFVGGRYMDAALRSERKGCYNPVPKAEQKRAMAFLDKYLFNEPTWLLRADYVTLTGYDINAYEERALAAAYKALLGRYEGLAMQELQFGSDKVYTLKELTDHLYQTAFGKSGAKLDFFTRAKQAQYVKVIMNFLPTVKHNATSEVIGLLTAQLQRISREMKSQSSADAITRNHRAALAAQIDAWLSGDPKTLTK